MNYEWHLRVIGTLFVLLSFTHIGFPKYLHWREQLATLDLINRQVMKVHTLFIALMVFLLGVLCLTSASELTSTPLGQRISFGLGIFWGIRLVVQLFGYSSELWRGKRFETVVHATFTVFWIYLTVVFLKIALR